MVKKELNKRRVERDVLEYTCVTSPHKVDRDAGIIYDCKLVGLTSKNGGRYTLEALRNALNLYEGAKCNLNHPDRGAPHKDRDVNDRFGVIKNCEVRADGIYGNLHCLKSHPFANRAFEAAENPSLQPAFGFSQNAKTIQVPDGNGGVIHESITGVRSIDLVADPATTSSIFESEDYMNEPSTQGDMDGAVPSPNAGNLVDSPVENGPIDIAIDALLEQYLPKAKAAKEVGERKSILTELTKKISAIIDVLAADEAETAEPEAKTLDEEGEVKESVKEVVVSESTTVVPPEKPDYEKAIDVLESCKVQPTSQRIKFLLAVPEDHREALAKTWVSATTVPKPRSSSVLESQGIAGAPKQSPVITPDKLKQDAMLLVSGSRY